MALHRVKETPQAFIDGSRVRRYDDLRRFFGLSVLDASSSSYQPVVAVFVVVLLMAIAAMAAMAGGEGSFVSVRTVEWFVAFAMCILAILKLQDLESFSTMFLNYDLLARRA